MNSNTIRVSENTATGSPVIYTDYYLKKITIDVSDKGYLESRLILVAGLGKELEQVDPVTGNKLTQTIAEKEIFNGSFAGYLSLLDTAISSNVITEQQKQDLIGGQLDIYNQLAQGFVATANILLGVGRLELLAKKVIE